MNWGGWWWWGGIGRGGTRLPGRKNAVKPRASPHQRPAAPAHPIRAIGGRRSGERRRGESAPRAQETSPEDEGRSLPAGGRSADPGQPQPSAGEGWAGLGSARPQSGPRAAAGSEARQMPAASCTSHAPFSSSALRPAPVPALFFHAEPGWGEGPTPGAPGRPAAQRGLPAPGALTPSRSAPTCRRPWPAVLRGRRDEPGWRAGGAVGSGPRQRARGPAAGCPVRSGSAAPRWESEPGAPRVAAALCARGRRSATMWSSPGAESRPARPARSLSLTRRAPASHPRSP